MSPVIICTLTKWKLGVSVTGVPGENQWINFHCWGDNEA